MPAPGQGPGEAEPGGCRPAEPSAGAPVEGRRCVPGGARCDVRPSSPPYPGRRDVTDGAPGHVSQLFGRVAGAGATLGRVRENELPEAPGRSPGRNTPHCPAKGVCAGPTRGSRPGVPWQDDWVRRCVSVSLGRGRRRSMRKGSPGGSSARGTSAPGRARWAASSVRLTHQRCRRGPCKRRASNAIRSGVVSRSSWRTGRGCFVIGGPTRVIVGPEEEPPARPSSLSPGPAAGSPHIRAGKSSPFLQESFSKEGRGEGALGLPGSPRTSRALRAGPRRRGGRPRSASLPISQMARPLCAFRSFLTAERGEGGESPGSQAPGVSASTPWPPTAPLRRTRSPHFHTSVLAPVRSYRPRVFRRRGGGEGALGLPGSPRTSRERSRGLSPRLSDHSAPSRAEGLSRTLGLALRSPGVRHRGSATARPPAPRRPESREVRHVPLRPSVPELWPFEFQGVRGGPRTPPAPRGLGRGPSTPGRPVPVFLYTGWRELRGYGAFNESRGGEGREPWSSQALAVDLVVQRDFSKFF